MEWVAVGKLSKTHGLQGEFKIHPFITDEGILKEIRHAKLTGKNVADTEVEVESVRGHMARPIVKFKGLDSIESASPLAGRTLYVRRDDFQALPEGEYYWFEIEGLKVYDEEGRCYGSVVEIIETGSNDVYVVRDVQKEILLPMIDSVVKTIDLEQGKLVFHKVEGLIEDTPV